METSRLLKPERSRVGQNLLEANAERGPALWGGLECTVNRVGGIWFDQMERGGHLERTGDFALLQELGLTTLRYGLHWERAERAGSVEVFAPQMDAMRGLGITPIAGLLHHGSGPEGTSLMDPGLGEKLAEYALRLARRYPWVSHYTPVNEPQTTARFSGLYAHWYPHHRCFASYTRMLINQLRASVLAMRAIRTVRSDAVFVHTEDAGKTWSTPELEGLCAQREQRRWIGADLLCGRVDEGHPLYEFLRLHGLTQREILWFAENACPPDVLGLNYYVTSDRFLDHRVWMYPAWLAGGDSGDEPLVDIEAVRLRPGGIAGAGVILKEAWERYGIPVAITEAHLGGPPEEQVRWLTSVWNEAKAARAAGVDCVAVTAWALFGSYDWCSLVTRNVGVYEPGVFAVRRGMPVETPLTDAVRRVVQSGELRRDGPGWWARPDRFTFDPVLDDAAEGFAAAPLLREEIALTAPV